MNLRWFAFAVTLIFYSGTEAWASKKKAERNGKYYDHLVDAGTLEAIDKRFKMANPLLNSYRTSVLFYLYTKNTVDSPQILFVNDVPLLKSSMFDATKKTYIVCEGYTDNVRSDIIQRIKNALLKFNDVNVIGLDWSYYTKSPLYSWVVWKVAEVGNYVGRFVTFLMKQGLSPENVHILGHSLGAHVSGFAGKTLRANGYVAARVTGLDPALPGFVGDHVNSRLASTDAQFVDCIHTCAGLLGYDDPICQADFFPNGGVNVQPGCDCLDFGICSHGRSHEYFAESIDSTHHFYSMRCNAVVDGTPYGCNEGNVEMGFFASPENLGVFYLTTSSRSPFSLNISSTLPCTQRFN